MESIAVDNELAYQPREPLINEMLMTEWSNLTNSLKQLSMQRLEIYEKIKRINHLPNPFRIESIKSNQRVPLMICY